MVTRYPHPHLPLPWDLGPGGSQRLRSKAHGQELAQRHRNSDLWVVDGRQFAVPVRRLDIRRRRAVLPRIGRREHIYRRVEGGELAQRLAADSAGRHRGRRQVAGISFEEEA